MNHKKFLVLFSVLTLLWLCFIFGQSLVPAHASNAKSDQIIETIRPVIDPEQQIQHRTLDFLVRKGAHLLEYLLLGMLLGGLHRSLGHLTGRWQFPWALFLGLSAGVCDEYIQSFTDRSSQVRDILIDFCGVLLGLAAAWVLAHWILPLLRRLQSAMFTK